MSSLTGALSDDDFLGLFDDDKPEKQEPEVPQSLDKNNLKQGPGTAPPKRSANVSTGRESTFKHVPKKVADHLKSKFSIANDTTSQTDCLLAYLYCFGHGDMRDYLEDVMTDKQWKLVESFTGDRTDDLQTSFARLEKKFDKLARREDIQLLVSIYHLMDRLVINSAPLVHGFDPFAGPGSTEHDLVIDMLKKLEQDAKRMRSKCDEPNGREISKNVGNKTIPKP